MPDSRIRKEVDEALRTFVDRKRPELLSISGDLVPLVEALDALLAGGKRLRPAFGYWGWNGAGGDDGPGIVRAMASLELLQASALIHDDVMDASDTRRGRPSAHRRFERMHQEAGWPGAAEPFGEGAAILLGDLCLSWSAEMYADSGLDPAALSRGRPVYDLMRTEMMCGQYLDLLVSTNGGGSVKTVLRVVEYKSAKYTVERPLQLGAELAGAGPEVSIALSAFGRPLGIAFQLRDDVLGVFGDPTETGKPVGDDLREGKRTALVALTLERADTAQAATMRRRLGDRGLDAAGVDELRTIIVETGGLAACERMIQRYAEQADAALCDVPIITQAREALASLAVAATFRHA